MGSIIGACVGSMCAGLCCGACRQCSGQKTGFISRIPYIFLFVLAGIFAVVMSLYGEKQLDLKFYSVQACQNDTCTGNGSVYRTSFILFAFFLLHCLIIGGGAISFHWLWFAIKFIVFVAALTITFVVGVDDGSGNEFFNGYAIYFARYVSAVYLLIQILILISWGYKVNEYMQARGNQAALPDSPDQDEDERSHSCNCYFWGLAIGSFALFAASFTLCGFFFVWYGDVDTSACGGHRTLISLTIVICLINGVLSVIRGDGSFFVSSVVSFYCTFLLFAALQSDDSETCNVFAASGSRSTASLWIGYIVTLLAIVWAAIKADSIGLLLETDEESEEMEKPLLNDEQKKDSSKDIEKGTSEDIVNDSNYNDVDDQQKSVQNEDGKEQDANLPSKKEQKRSNVFFHFVMMLCSCYMAMLFTNWGSGQFTTSGKASMWVNIVSQYATAILFWW
eukprot:CAMPEP_0197020458 /NCGR_PEP_ID=MMETSP1384-20130603/1241_1 /TAXON_ID=29189 /ORGANISM="Ammonia sp." /LENGTH=449 /DNA_ID=CAMNT_0042448083 /DNA_START=37 /DNA_END=1383 /DNA_ORIENTATION=+